MYRETLLVALTRYHTERPAHVPSEAEKQALQVQMTAVFQQPCLIVDYTVEKIK